MNPEIEARLNRHGIDWTLVADYQLDQIDRTKSTAEAVRDIDPDTVAQYVADLEAGDPFPPLVVRKVRTRGVLIGGGHRLAALDQLGRTTHPAYVVSCKPDQAVLLALDDNRTHGRPLTGPEKRQWAVRLVDQGYSQTDAARIVGIHCSTVSTDIRARAVTALLQEAGLDPDGLTHHALHRISSLPDDAECRLSVAKAAIAGWLSSSQVSTLVAQVNAADPEDRLDLIDRTVVDAMERQGARRRTGPPPTKGMSPDLARLVRLGRDICDVPRTRLSGSQRGVDEARDVMRSVARWMLACDEMIEVR